MRLTASLLLLLLLPLTSDGASLSVLDRSCSTAETGTASCTVGLAVWTASPGETVPHRFPTPGYKIAIHDEGSGKVAHHEIDIFGDVFMQVSSLLTTSPTTLPADQVAKMVGEQAGDHMFGLFLDSLEEAVPLAAVNDAVLIASLTTAVGYAVLRLPTVLTLPAGDVIDGINGPLNECLNFFKGGDPAAAAALCGEAVRLAAAAAALKPLGAAWRANPLDFRAPPASTSLPTAATAGDNPAGSSFSSLPSCRCAPWPAQSCSCGAPVPVPSHVNLLAMVLFKSSAAGAGSADLAETFGATHRTAPPSNRGATVVCPGHEQDPLVRHVAAAVAHAENPSSSVPPSIESLQPATGERMTLAANRMLLSQLCSAGHPLAPRVRYLEIGAYRGSSLAAAVAGNGASLSRADSVDSFEEFIEDGFTPEQGKELVLGVGVRAAQGGRTEVNVHNLDFRDPGLIEGLKAQGGGGEGGGGVGVYLFDGPHSRTDHADAFLLYDGVMEDTFIAVIDDWSLSPVREGTRDAFSLLGYRVLYQRLVSPPSYGAFIKSADLWHSGIGVFVLRKKSGGDDAEEDTEEEGCRLLGDAEFI